MLGAGRTFVAGADITTLEPLAWDASAPKPDLRPLFERIESSPKPVVMAMHGTALGGGLELAMAGHYRVATADARLGQPECALGIIPGAEGTQRLPRLAGVEKALDMGVTSKPISAADALTHGIVDEVIDGDLLDGAVEFAERIAADGGPHPKTSERTRQARHAGRQRAAVRGGTCDGAEDQAAPAGAAEGDRRDRSRHPPAVRAKAGAARPRSSSSRSAPNRRRR